MIEAEPNPTLEDSSLQKTRLDDYKLNIDNIISQISILRDGNQWCALIGRDLQEGISGFGETIAAALRELADKLSN